MDDFLENAPTFCPNEGFSWPTILTDAILDLDLSRWQF